MHVQVQVQHLHFTYLKATPVTLHPQNAAVITEKVSTFRIAGIIRIAVTIEGRAFFIEMVYISMFISFVKVQFKVSTF